MTTNDSNIPEILQNAEFVTIQFPSEEARAKRALKKFALVSVASAAAMIAAIVVINNVDKNIPEED